MIDSADVYKLDSRVRFRRLFDEAVLIHQERAEAMVLNDTAVSFLELLDGDRSAGEVADELTRQFDVDRQTLFSDLEPLIAELTELDIIMKTGGEGA